MKLHNNIAMVAAVFMGSFLLLAGCHSNSQHQQHMQQMQEGKNHTSKIESYDIPAVTLINQDREQVKLQELLSDTRPILLQFIFADCTTICPVLSSGFSNFQKKLGPKTEEVQLVSITIDPESDSPEVMKKYLTRYQAQPGWNFLTGNRKDINQVMNAFNAYVSNKMSHYPLTFLKTPDNQWVRIDGLVGTDELLLEYRKFYSMPM